MFVKILIVIVVLVLIVGALWLRNIWRAIQDGSLKARLEEIQRRQQGAAGGLRPLDPGEMAKALEAQFQADKEAAERDPDPTPDKPSMYCRYFDHIAVKSDDDAAVRDVLGMADGMPCNWESAQDIIPLMLNRRVFVSPSINGWVMIFGQRMEPTADNPKEGLWEVLAGLSRTFGEAQYFAFSSTTMVNAYARFVDGDAVRAYYCAANDGLVLWNDGPRTSKEMEKNLLADDTGFTGTVPPGDEGDRYFCLAEEAAEYMATEWSIDPGGLSEMDLEKSAGTLGFVDAEKLLERVREG